MLRILPINTKSIQVEIRIYKNMTPLNQILKYLIFNVDYLKK